MVEKAGKNIGKLSC